METKIYNVPSLFEVRFIDRASGCERPHTHQTLIIAAVQNGSISLQVNDTNVVLDRGKTVFIGPNILHHVRSYSHDFSGVFIFEVFSLPVSCEEFDSTHLEMFNYQLQQNNHSYEKFLDICKHLLCSEKNNFLKNKLCSEYIKNIFTDYYLSNKDIGSKEVIVAGKIRSILDNCREEKPPFSKISNICKHSREHCNRIFKRTYNISVQAYFLNKKASRARELLISNKSLSQIALECGFYDQSHFTRIFKEIFQISPGKYRDIISQPRHSHTR